jgi:hypothetical protein
MFRPSILDIGPVDEPQERIQRKDGVHELQLVVSLTLAVFGFILIFTFFRKSLRFPRFFIIFMLSSLACTLFLAWLGSLVFREEPVFDPETARGFARQVLACLIWIPYMISSERVQATFTRSRHATIPQIGQSDLSSTREASRTSSRKTMIWVGAVVVGLLILTFAGAVLVSVPNLATERAGIDSVSFDSA